MLRIEPRKEERMRIFNSAHPHPLTFKQIIVDAKEIRLVLFCEVCNRNVILTAPAKE